MNDTRVIIEKADLGIVELVWLAAAMDAYLPREQRPLISIETVYLVEWPYMEVALDRWEEGETNPNHLDVIHKVRAAAESLEGGTS
jgi:hypothetical protein